MDVHHRVSAGNGRTLPAAVALWDVVKNKLDIQGNIKINSVINNR